MIKIGIGYDLHRLVKGRKLFIGGVKIPFKKGALGHSDADALLHAICDALLGAAGLGDIGMHFPDNDPQYKGISSLKLLEMTGNIINKKKKTKIINIDAIVICDEPKISKYSPLMKRKISDVLGIRQDAINIKGKTTEKTSPDTIVSYAAALVER